MTERSLFHTAKTLFAPLAEEADLPPDGWSHRILASRVDASCARILLLCARGDQRLVLKHEARPKRPEEFLGRLAAQSDAHALIGRGGGLRIPEILAADAETQSLLMEYADGEPLATCLDGASPDEQARLLQLAGAWVSAFHACRAGDRRIFQPKHQVRYLRQILDEHASGARMIAAPDRFRAAADRLIAMASRFEGQETVSVHQHGDLHMRNILIGAQVWGIDANAGNMAPVGHDIARLLIDYAAIRAPQSDIPTGALLPVWASEAFFDGYTLTAPDDPSVGMLLRHRLLADWWGLPAQSGARSVAQATRLAGLLRLAETAFGV